jgi:hypothetical protein
MPTFSVNFVVDEMSILLLGKVQITVNTVLMFSASYRLENPTSEPKI